MLGSMGLASAIGLGLSLADRDTPTVVLDGDGNLLMNLGILPLVAALQPRRFVHIVFDNEVYGSTGNQRSISSQSRLDRLAAAAGDPALLATDAAELLVRSGTPFRKAHEVVGREVLEGTLKVPWNLQVSLGKRDLPGAPHPRRVAARVTAVRREAGALRRWTRGHPPRLPS